MFNYRKLKDENIQIDFPEPKYMYKQLIQVIGSYRLNIIRGSTLFSVENHGDNIILKINGESKFIERNRVRILNNPITGDDIIFEHENAYITVTIITNV